MEKDEKHCTHPGVFLSSPSHTKSVVCDVSCNDVGRWGYGVARFTIRLQGGRHRNYVLNSWS